MMPRLLLIACLALTGIAVTCSTPREITAERAIRIARPLATFEIASTEVERAADAGRPVWRVTFRGKPASPELPELRPIVIVLIDRRSGEIVSVAKS